MNRNADYWKEVEAVANSIPDIDKLRRKSIIITGATGLICSAITDVLLWIDREKDMQMQIFLAGRSASRLADKFRYCKEGSEYKFIRFDSSVPDGLNEDIKYDYAIYGASYGDPKAISGDPTGIIYSNIMGLDAVLRKAVKSKARVLFISSSEVYGKTDSKHAYAEGDYGYIDILNPRASYPGAKRLGETLCIAYSEQYGVETVIARPGHIYGPHITATDSRASAEFSRHAFNGEPIVMKSPGLQLRSYVYSLDCASAILTMLIKGKNKEAYNISNPESVVTIREMAEQLAKAGRVELISEAPSEKESRSYNLMSRSDLNANKLLLLGWKPQYDIVRGTEATLKYM